jgi:large subunit ribosomal protein L34
MAAKAVVGYTTAVPSGSGKGDSSIKRTYQPKKRYRRRVHGFLRRMASVGGARVVQNRRRKGRKRLTP